MVSFLSRSAQLESSFSYEKKNISDEILDIHLWRSYKSLSWQSIKRKFHHWQKLWLYRVAHNTYYTDNVDGDVPLTVEKV